MAVEHTKTPWRAISNENDPFHFYLYSEKDDALILWIDRRNDISISHADRTEADADLIARAVNAHEALAAALDWMIAEAPCSLEGGEHESVVAARAALFLAKGE